MCKSCVIYGYTSEKLVKPFSGWFILKFSSEKLDLNIFSSTANDWRHRGHVVFELFSIFKIGKIQSNCFLEFSVKSITLSKGYFFGPF